MEQTKINYKKMIKAQYKFYFLCNKLEKIKF